MFRIVKRSFPQLDDEIIKNRIENLVKERLQSKEVRFVNDYDQTEVQLDLLKFIDWTSGKLKPILTGNGVVTRPHGTDRSLNLRADMLKFLLDRRRATKSEMFEYINTDPEKFNSLDRSQKIDKLLANSYYGVTGEKNSIFYDRHMGPAVTYTGVQIITTSVMAFEAFLANNIEFNNVDDALIFIDRVLSQEYEYEFLIDDDKTVDNEQLANYLYSRINKNGITDKDYTLIYNTVKNLSVEECSYIYYKNNLLKFFENSAVLDLLKDILTGEHGVVTNNGKIVDENKESLDLLWDICKEYVMYDYIPYDRYERALNNTRKAVLLVDTDSNFINLDPFYRFMKNNFEIPDTNDGTNAVINVMIYVLSKFIQKSLDRLTENLNVPEDKRSIINMKSEFLYSRLLLTTNKKQYAGNLIGQEGNILEKPKLDMKGMAIRKVTVNQTVREYFTDILENDVLRASKIDIPKILAKFRQLEKIIADDLRAGNINFSIPNNLNEVGSYKYPFRMQQVRGMLIWNQLFPENLINPPDKINILKLKAETLQDLEPIYGTKEFDIIRETIFENEDLQKYGFTVIAMPKDVDKIPEWLIQFIDIDSIVSDNVRNGIIILESLGVKALNILNSTYYSNIIDF